MRGARILNRLGPGLLGRNDQGQLGLGDDKDRSFPRKMEVVGKVVDVACGRRHTLVLTDDGFVHAVGDNTSGQLGGLKRRGFIPRQPRMVEAVFVRYPLRAAAVAGTVLSLTQHLLCSCSYYGSRRLMC